MTRRFSILFVSTLCLVAGSRAGAQVTKPIPISVTSQELCIDIGDEPCVQGAPPTQLDFDESDGQGLSVTGSIKAEVVEGKLVYTISGTATNASGNQRYLNLTSEEQISFTVPKTSAGGVALPTTIVATTLSAAQSTLPQNFTRVFGPVFVPDLSSSALGATLAFDQGVLALEADELRKVKLEVMIGNDLIQGSIDASYFLIIPGGASNAVFNETLTYELRQVARRAERP